MIHDIALYLVDKIGDMGYLGIFLLMFLESTFFPFPSEVIMIPAGYLAYKGEMSLVAVILVGILGSVAGALFNYYIARYFGRTFLVKYGRYLLVKPETLEKLERFFTKHGELSTFNGRLIPGIRQLISLPAGLAKMPIVKFSFYTALGAGIWVVVLVGLGYLLGSNEALLSKYLSVATWIALFCVMLITLFYIIRNKRRHKILDEE
ncbi:MAG: DedA family protein [Sulfurovum sp.]|nr:MAG: DedA family protein [Sulfurovum sp.]